MKPLRELSTEQIEELTDDEIIESVAGEIQSCRTNGADLEEEHVAHAPWLEKAIRELWRAEKERRTAKVVPLVKPALSWRRIAVSHHVVSSAKSAGASFILPAPQPAADERDNLYERARKVRFHESDKIAPPEPLPTIEEKEKALDELADLYKVDPLAYVEKVREWTKKLCTTQDALNKAVKLVLDKREDDGEQSQATKLIGIGIGDKVSLWHGADAFGYATVLVNDDHYENYRLDHRAFERWLTTEYGRRNQAKIDGKLIPQVPYSNAVRDAVRGLEGIARIKGEEHQTAMRVGGDRDVILLDLGRPDWKMIEVTADGWRPLSGSLKHVAFLRNDQTLPLPEPTRGGDIRDLRKVLNLQSSQFVLACGWLLQALNPMGPYPALDVEGESENGKTSTCRYLIRLIDPSTAGLRKIRTPNDTMVSARNNWIVGFDNLSYMSTDMADTFCMMSTGIASGTRAHYTNDEEHVFNVKRPVIFNGIPPDLAERADLASRTIGLLVPPLTIERLTEEELDEAFERIWPGTLGALLDGLVGAIRDRRSIRVDDPARMMDFERFGEAGCRAMGFADWEFVDAYEENRKGLLVIAAQSNAVGRLVVKFLVCYPNGFQGKMQDLYDRLEGFKEEVPLREWPRNAIKLSGQLRRCAKALKAIGVRCELNIDNRGAGGSQKELILERAENWSEFQGKKKKTPPSASGATF
jgi:hypothetical protein